MAKTPFVDKAGYTNYVDEKGYVWTEGGKNPTNLKKADWDKRQQNRWGTGGGDASDPVSSFVNSVIGSTTQRINDEVNFVKRYTQKNPFAFDEELARKSSEAEFEPYYNEILSDYLGDIETRRQTIQDDQALTETLKKYDDLANNRDFVSAIQKTREGYAGRGLYFSGMREREEGVVDAVNEENKARNETIYQSKLKGYQDNTNYLNTLASRKQRDIGREKQEAIEGGVLTRENEAIKAYNVPFMQSYQRQFPNSSSGALSGYLVPEALRY